MWLVPGVKEAGCRGPSSYRANSCILTFYERSFILQDLEYEDHDVKLVMNNEDRRFGFSVIGGYDEGIAPRVDDITSGERDTSVRVVTEHSRAHQHRYTHHRPVSHTLTDIMHNEQHKHPTPAPCCHNHVLTEPNNGREITLSYTYLKKQM